MYTGRTPNFMSVASGGNNYDYSTWSHHMDMTQKFVNKSLAIKAQAYHGGVQREFANRNRKQAPSNYKVNDVVKIVIKDSFGKLKSVKGPYLIKEKVKQGFNLVDINSETGDKVNIHPVPWRQLAPWSRAGVVSDIVQAKAITADVEKIIGHRDSALLTSDRLDGLAEESIDLMARTTNTKRRSSASNSDSDRCNVKGPIHYRVLWTDGTTSEVTEDAFNDRTIVDRYWKKLRKTPATAEVKSQVKKRQSNRRRKGQ